MPDFTFVTYAGMPDLDPDDRLAADELAGRGLAVAAAVWDDPEVDWATAGVCAIRSTWDYDGRHNDFVAWARAVGSATPLWNPPDVVRWNTHKFYLQELEKRGVPIVPTAWLPACASADLALLLRGRGWERAVIKPAVGLATHGVKMFGDHSSAELAAAQEHLDALLRAGDALVQPYVESVEDYGERASIFIDGEYTHAARKTAFQPLLPTGEAGETPVEASNDEVELAKQVMRAVELPTLYGRVDLVRDNAGRPMVIELELVEPSLFLAMHPPAARKFADALCARAS